ncbi:hypothetical protein LguiB_034585 [Lonicera macranthoides]
MQGNRGNRDRFLNLGDPFAGFGGFGGQRSLMSSFFGGRDPFDDPFFTRPFGGMFESNIFGPTGSSFMNAQAPGFLPHQSSQPNRSRGPIIEELNSDDEKELNGGDEKKENPRKHGRSSKEPYVEDPDDEAEERKSKQIHIRNELNSLNNTKSRPQARSFTFQSSTVTYGSSNGAYRTSSTTRRTGSDGLTFEESKEADSATGQAAHRLLRGIHNKGHTVSRKLNSDGRVDTMQTLHNLNEGELPAFEDAWKGNARKHLPGRTEGISVNDGSGSSIQNGPASRGGWALPSTECSHYSGSTEPITSGHMAGSAWAKSKGASASKTDKATRH